MRKAMRALAAAMALAIAMLGCTACACSQTDEEILRKTVSEQFDSYKNMEDAALSRIANSAESTGMGDLGISGMEYASAVLDGFDYHIDSIEIDENAASVAVTIVSKSSTDFRQRYKQAVDRFKGAPDTNFLTDNEKNREIGNIAMETFRDADIVEEEVVLEFELQGSKWVNVDDPEVLASLDSLIFAK